MGSPTGTGNAVGAEQDPRLEDVVRTWYPRFVANGIDALDLDRVLSSVQSWGDWPDAWEREAEEWAERGQAARAVGHLLTGAEHLRRAALTLQFAQFVLNDDPSRRAALHRRQCELYASAAPDLQPPALRAEVPTAVGPLPGYLRRPGRGPTHGVVLLVPGLESTKEQFSTYEPFLLDRGLATLSIEGPGQGETRRRLPFRDDDYGRAVGGVSRWVDENLADLGPVVVLGTSFGGYLALRHGTQVHRLAALVDIAGPYDLAWYDEMKPVLQEGFRHLVGADGPTTRDLLSSMTLADVLPRIEVPTLVLHGGSDPVVPVEHAHRIAAGLGGVADLMVHPEGGHSCQNLHTLVRPAVGDWVRDAVLASA